MRILATSTLATRIALIQTAVTAFTLLLVAAGTLAAMRWTSMWAADQLLTGTLDRASTYVAAAHPNAVDWKWLETEINETRPRQVEVNVADSTGKRLKLGNVGEFAISFNGCLDHGSIRMCAMPVGAFRLAAALGRDNELSLQRKIGMLLTLISLGAAVAVAFSSQAITRRAVLPLSQLSCRIANIEPGSGARVHMHSELEEVDTVARCFDTLVSRFEEALEREKRFAAVASHELRTPLTLAMAEVEALRKGEGDGGETERTIAALARLSALSDSLLWFARAQSRSLTERGEVVNICDLIRQHVQMLGQRLPDQLVEVSAPDEALVCGDEPLLLRAIANLFDNAVKYGARSPVEVRVSRVANVIQMWIANGGQGIPSEARDEIFEPFFRSHESANVSEGFGLGLPFARAVARAHGGDLVLASAVQPKTELRLELPLVDWSDVASPI